MNELRKIAENAQDAQDATPEGVCAANATANPSSNVRQPIRFMKFEKSSGYLTKRLYRDDSPKGFGKDGGLCRMSRGTAHLVIARDLHEVAAAIDGLAHNEAIALGVFADGVTEAEVASRAVATGDVRTRTKGGARGLIFDRGGPGLLLIDVDVDHIVEGFDGTVVGIFNTLLKVFPVLSGKACLGRASTSSGIYFDGARLDDPLKAGHHLYFPVANAADISEILRRIDLGLWLAGHGRIKISRAGARLYRTPVDAAVGSPERLIFEAPPVLEGGLEQQERPIHVQDGDYLRLDDFPDIGVLDLLRISDLRRSAYDAAAAEAARARSAWLDERALTLARRLMAEEGLGEDEAMRRARRDLKSSDKSVLTGSFVLSIELEDHEDRDVGVTIDDLYADPHSFAGAYCRDPFEPEKGPQKARIRVDDDGFIYLHAWTHGGTDYLLLPSYAGLVKRISDWAALDADARTRLRADCARADMSASEHSTIRNSLTSLGERARDIDRIFKEVGAQRKSRQEEATQVASDELETLRLNVDVTATHAVVARDLRDYLQCEGVDPVFDQGKVFTFVRGLWVEVPDATLRTVIGLSYRHCDIVRRGTDYGSVLRALQDLIHRPGFFDDTKPGVAIGDRFWSVTAAGTLIDEPLLPGHGARFKLPFDPDFDKREPSMLGDLFTMVFEPEDRDDLAFSLGALMGSAVLGLGHVFKEAGFLIGAGDTGKSTLGALLTLFLPKSAVAAVPLGRMDHEYSLAELSGARLNLPGEEAADVVIPAAALKQITGGDPLAARRPYGQPFSFVSRALQWFTANKMPPLREHEAQVYRRIVFIQFSREIPVERRIGKTEIAAQKMFDAEAAHILGWALTCAAKAVALGTMQTPATMKASKAWRQSEDSVLDAFLGADTCFRVTGSAEDRIAAKSAFDLYKEFTEKAGRKPLGRNNFYERIKSAPDLKSVGVTLFEDRKGHKFVSGVVDPRVAMTEKMEALVERLPIDVARTRRLAQARA